MRTKQSFNILVLFSLLCHPATAQFGKVEVTFDDRLLRSDERQIVQSLPAEISRFFTNTVWDEDYSALEIPVRIQFIFEGVSEKGAVRTFLIQALFSAGVDLRYFDKAVQFYYSEGSALYYDPVLFDPLASFLAYYANLILANEIDTYQPLGGTLNYELSRSIAIRGNASDYSRGWAGRIELIDDYTANAGLRKARFAFYYARDLFNSGAVETAIQQFKSMINGLNEVYDRFPREYQTLYFLKAHAEELSRMLGLLRQDQILQDLIGLDPDNKDIYLRGLDIKSE